MFYESVAINSCILILLTYVFQKQPVIHILAYTNMVSVNSENDPAIVNPVFESENDKNSPTVLHSPVLESKVADEGINNPTKKEENKSNNALREKWITMQQYTHLVPLIISMAIVVALLQIPTILYYTDPPSAEITLLDSVDLESCSVS